MYLSEDFVKQGLFHTFFIGHYKNIFSQMIINSNDIFSQIGLVVDPKRKSNYNTQPKYVICL